MEKNFTKNIDQPFGWEPNEIIFSSKLSLKAKGLWLYMNAKPEGWFFAAERIAEECADGIASIRTALKELADVGLLTWKKQGDGRVVYTLKSESSKLVENPQCENRILGTDPKCENPTMRKPHNAKIALINNKEENKERIIIKKEATEQKPNARSAPTSAVLAGDKPAGGLVLSRDDYKTEDEYERAFYAKRTVTVAV